MRCATDQVALARTNVGVVKKERKSEEFLCLIDQRFGECFFCVPFLKEFIKVAGNEAFIELLLLFSAFFKSNLKKTKGSKKR